jgi:hypothetical protein
MLALVQMVLESPDKSAIGIALIIGALFLLRMLRAGWHEDAHHETLMETLLRENREKSAENAELRKELLRMRLIQPSGDANDTKNEPPTA